MMSLFGRKELRWAIGFCAAAWLGCHRAASEAPASRPAAARQEEPVPVRVALVERRAVQRRVSVVGTLEAFERVIVTPKVEGRVQQLYAEVSDRVRPGQVLLQIEPVDYQLAVDVERRLLEEELTRLELDRLPGADFDIEQLPSVESARLRLEQAQRVYDRERALLKANAGVQQSFEEAETNLKVAQATLRQARLEAHASLAAVRRRQAQLAVAEERLRQTQVEAPPPPPSLHQAAEVTYAVARRMVAVGEMVRAFPSTPVFELVIDAPLKLRVKVPERYLAQVAVGQPIAVQVDAYPGEQFQGQVARVYPTIDPENRSFLVEAQVSNADYRLRPGGFAKAAVVVAESDDATTVPLEAIVRFAGVTKVFAIRDNKAQEVEVTLGTQEGGWVEVRGALAPGDRVVVSGQSKLFDGSPVVVRDALAQTPTPPTFRR
jgi:RND family efflux transporter MFP subunit